MITTDVALKEYRLQQIDELSKEIIRIYGFLKKGILQISSLLMKFLLSINHEL